MKKTHIRAGTFSGPVNNLHTIKQTSEKLHQDLTNHSKNIAMVKKDGKDVKSFQTA